MCAAPVDFDEAWAKYQVDMDNAFTSWGLHVSYVTAMITAPNYGAFKTACINAMQKLATSVAQATGINSYSYIYRDHDWVLWFAGQPSNGAEEYELTWQKICEAWLANDFEGRALTIAIIDKMRQIIWDEPFYVNWAARPKV